MFCNLKYLTSLTELGLLVFCSTTDAGRKDIVQNLTYHLSLSIIQVHLRNSHGLSLSKQELV